MGNPKIILLVLYLIEGSLFIGLSFPLIRGRIGPNAWFGFRVKRTLENPQMWYPANRYAGYHLLGLGAVLLLAATTLYALPQVGFISYALICLALTLLGLVVGLIRSFRYLGRLEERIATRG